MANLHAGLDPTWAHLPAAAGHCGFFPAAAFENEALTSALRASMAPAHGSPAATAKHFSSPATPSSSTSSASELLSSSGGHDAPAPASRPAAADARPPPARALKGPKEGRVAKRKTRPSRRAQTTYITADAANFRRMVQEITGLPVPGPASSSPAASVAAAAAPSWTPVPAPAFVLPTLDTSAFLLDSATAAPAVPEAKCSSGSASTATAAAAAAAGDRDSSALLEMEAMMDFPFPTLESWGFI
ncbi:unnamed protein product [Urochloa humidicola]